MFISILLLSLEASYHTTERIEVITHFSAVVACLNNVGPGFESIGPMGNYSAFSAFGKLLLCLDMLIGRLEIFPMLLLFSPAVWLRK